jgi:hypothetical protein
LLSGERISPDDVERGSNLALEVGMKAAEEVGERR